MSRGNKPLNLSNASQVGAARYSSNVTYWTNAPDLPVGSGYFDANLTASEVEHLMLPWYVRGVDGASFDPQVNILNDISLV